VAGVVKIILMFGSPTYESGCRLGTPRYLDWVNSTSRKGVVVVGCLLIISYYLFQLIMIFNHNSIVFIYICTSIILFICMD
jgi:hypothetical protein